MGIFTRKKILGQEFLSGGTDCHSHILPGVDDGFKTLEDSLEALRLLEATGLKNLWLTPHIMEDYPNETDDLRRRFEELCNAYSGPIQLHLASENMLDPLFGRRLPKRDFLPIGPAADTLLIETSCFNPPTDLYQLIDSIHSAGYYIMMAHPERYAYMDKETYLRLRNLRIRFQLNYGSFTGRYGNTARKKAEWLLKNDMADAFGSDAHRLSSISHQLDSQAASWVPDKLKSISSPFNL